MEVINDYRKRAEDLKWNGYYVQIESYVRKGFHIFRQKPELFLIYTIIILGLFPLGGFFFAGPFIAGFLSAAHRIDKNRPVYFEHFFDGFRNFIPLFLVALAMMVISAIGYFLFIIPGIYFTVAYLFAVPIVHFGNSDVWDGLVISRKVINREWLPMFGFVLVIVVLNLLGAMAFGVGLLFSIPISYCAIYAAFDDILKSEY